MPIYQITIESYYPAFGEYWTNVYHVSAADIDTAEDAMTPIVNAHKPMLSTGAFITKARVSDMVEGTDIYDTVAYNAAGTRTLPGDTLPLWMTVRVDFNTAGGGRPSRKYLRGALDENNTTALALSAGLVTAAQTYAAAIVAITGLVDVDGQSFVNGEVWPAPQMRQLRRGSKKKVTP